ncbi:hypothetical protein F1B92_00475 [Campylobacter sp. FMV-PI01]|uniref:Uncharacterized protein n=1 Tax=Campylobacter portucalensis TaxID=2608384 RepID=A0A6L5WG27_9BACT|nr:hypothetical protein [Campylobacter portucalensis]MSN95686.1 hypothetical protein [Campylobacter portucalensis]
MKKDVLLELVSTRLGEITRAELRGNVIANLSNPDRIYLVNMQNKLYNSKETKWDFKKNSR